MRTIGQADGEEAAETAEVAPAVEVAPMAVETPAAEPVATKVGYSCCFFSVLLCHHTDT